MSNQYYVDITFSLPLNTLFMAVNILFLPFICSLVLMCPLGNAVVATVLMLPSLHDTVLVLQLHSASHAFVTTTLLLKHFLLL